MSLLLPLNLKGFGSGGSSGGKKESLSYYRESCARNFDGKPLVATSTSTTGWSCSSKKMKMIMAEVKATFGGSNSIISRYSIIIIIIGSSLTLPLSLSISTCLSIYLSFYLSIYLYLYLYLSTYLSIYLPIYIFLSNSKFSKSTFYLSIFSLHFLNATLLACLFVCLFACLFACLLTYLPTCLLACMFAYLIACMPARLRVFLLPCLLVCLCAYLLICLLADTKPKILCISCGNFGKSKRRIVLRFSRNI